MFWRPNILGVGKRTVSSGDIRVRRKGHTDPVQPPLTRSTCQCVRNAHTDASETFHFLGRKMSAACGVTRSFCRPWPIHATSGTTSFSVGAVRSILTYSKSTNQRGRCKRDYPHGGKVRPVREHSDARLSDRVSALRTIICRLNPGVDSRASSPSASR